MEPFFFGPEGRSLFGTYHPPASRADRDVGVVVCNPFGREYLYSHRALRQLALRLAAAGFHVLRFDYSSTGDSQGDCAAADALQWTRDTALAIDELEERAGLDRVCLVGLRLGASMALHAASRRSDVLALVLWEPIVRAVEYGAELEKVHHEWLRQAEAEKPPLAVDGSAESLGFLIGPALRTSFRGLDEALATLRRPSRHALILRQRESPDALAQNLTDLGVKTEQMIQEAPSAWLGRGADGRVVVPLDLLEVIADWLHRKAS